MPDCINKFINKIGKQKKIFVLCLLIILMTQIITVQQNVYAASTDIDITSYTTSKDPNPIYEGDSFTLNVNFENTDSATAITNLFIVVEQSSAFYVPGSSSQFDFGTLAAGALGSKSISLKYNGGGKAISLKFVYSKDGGVTTTETTKTLYLNTQDSSSSNQPTTPTDTTKYKPTIESVFDNQMLTLEAGKVNTWKLLLQNNSSYSAKDIKVIVKYDDKLKDFVEINQTKQEYMTVDKIDPKKSAELLCPIKIDRAAIEGLYSIKLEYSYKNAWNDTFDGSETITFRLQNSKGQSNLTVESIKFDKETIKTGEDTTLMIKLKNSGDLNAKQVKATLNSIGEGYSLHNSTQIKEKVYVLGGTTETFKFPIVALDTAKTGNVQVKFTIEYLDESGKELKLENTAFVYLEVLKQESQVNANVRIKNLVAPDGTISIGKGFIVTFDVVNEGTGDAKNLKINLTGDGSIISKSMNPIVIEELKAGETRAVSFQYYVTSNASDKYYSFAINLEYQKNTDSASSFSTSQNFGFDVVSTSSIQSTPKIIVDNYTFDKEVVKAGEDFELRLSLFNTSKISSVNNIKISLSSGGEFIPVNGSNSIYVDHIPAQNKSETVIKLIPKSDLLSKFYQVTLKMEYEGEGELLKNPNNPSDKGTQYVEEETLSIPVYQEPRLKVQEPSMPPFAMVGQPVNLEAEFFNVGKSDIFNLEVKVEGDFQGQDMSYVVGNFAQGRNDYFSAQIIAMNEGENKGSLVFSYEDDLGKPLEFRKDFVINVQAMEAFNPGAGVDGKDMPVFNENGEGGFMGEYDGMDNMGRQPKILGIFSSLLSLAITVVIVIVIIVVTIILLKRRAKKKRGMTEDEEY